MLAGVIAPVWPGVKALALLFVVAFWEIMLGIGEIAAQAGRTLGLDAGRRDPQRRLFGILLLIWPARDILTLVWLVGIFTLVGGVALILVAFRSVATSVDAAAHVP